MESWRKVFRDGFAPGMSTGALSALKSALERDDFTLIQGATTHPPPLACDQDWPCEGGCAISYSGWKGENLETVGDVEEYFVRMCFDADQRLGEPAACRWFLNWFDDMPRDRMRSDLIAEIDYILSTREV